MHAYTRPSNQPLWQSEERDRGRKRVREREREREQEREKESKERERAAELWRKLFLGNIDQALLN